MLSPLESMRIVARRLEPADVPFAFVGGAVMVLLVDHPELSELRVTKDVDVIVEVLSYAEFSQLEERLRGLGFQHDVSEGAPICRWIVEDCRVDVMPMDSTSLGMNSRWFEEALKFANEIDLGQNYRAKAVSPALFIATKLEAFADRGKGDYYGSRDLEDIVTLMDGRGAIVNDVASALPKVRTHIASKFATMLEQPDFLEALPGHLSGLSRPRLSIVMERFRAISGLK